MLIKSPDDKTTRLRLLEELRKSDRLDDRQKAWLREEYWRLAPGVAGERDAAHYLDLSFTDSKNHAVLHDLRLEEDGLVAQIDHLILDRALTFFLLETKSYRGSLIINEHGEFSVEYTGERCYGIESPLEQSRRHETVLKKALDRLGIAGRIGTSPRFIHVVMVHPKATIERPPSKAFDTSMVIKADQFASWHRQQLAKIEFPKALSLLVNIRGRDVLTEWGELLRNAHRPVNPLRMPDFMKPSVVPVANAKPCSSHLNSPSEFVTMEKKPEQISNSSKPSAIHVCASCGKKLTPKVVKFCQDKASRFGGNLYCYDHQATIQG